MHELLHLRPGAPQDATPIAALAIQVFLDTYATQGIRPDLAREVFRNYSPEAFLERVHRPGCHFVLAEIDAALIGFAEVNVLAPPCLGTTSGGAELVRLYVQPAFQRARAGTRLLAAAEDVAKSTGSPALWLRAWDGNQRARDFYARRGYTDIGETVHVIEGQRYGNRVFRREI
ncbi:MAG: GNAT family N-acetyltransferase [Mitsuaria chitosanitabida]|uniref:GNAT family N-acetyltransferase n=1 Tax=Roseateles chitosanitabidus TaxID=65048 RepID=UPI001B0DD9CE|nr:GNAT family N-acetyltransferase [Roseateles chitosanitabidus]MBO9689060.1 GNAT family N-acetyltransferase [Roseateles chitosanitabidus]